MASRWPRPSTGTPTALSRPASTKALLIDFNYDYEPVPGKFPMPRLGPLPLLKESRLNHLGKLAFEWVYWNVLLPGREMPLVSAQMSLEGKDLSAVAKPAQTPAGAAR
jgi:sulfide:quinone oxidoreductase